MAGLKHQTLASSHRCALSLSNGLGVLALMQLLHVLAADGDSNGSESEGSASEGSASMFQLEIDEAQRRLDELDRILGS